ncbi:energy-coupling factor transporter transmembrane component T family protein [Solibacillus cecembensis]|uniref:energy-coupling factor transporter transmembrane component T family protein n=1 Tax=Solibacillus cecembensis TaxID=459347 RepID=UPI003D06E4F1
MTNAIQKLYPSTKMSIVLAVILFTLMMPGYISQYSVFPIFIIIAFISGVGTKFLSAFIKSIFVLALFIFVFQCFLIPSDTVIWSKGILTLYKEGLEASLLMTSKIIAISSSLIWFFLVTPIKDMMFALEKAGFSKKFTFVIYSTIQLIPQMKKLSQTILEAQKSRGIETEGSLMIRLRAFLPMLGPLVLSSIQQTEEKVLALEARAFSATVRKSSYYQMSKKPVDYLVVSVIFIGFMIFVWWRFFK